MTQSSGAPPIKISPGGLPVSFGSDAISLGSSGALAVDSSSMFLGSPPNIPSSSRDVSSVLQIGATIFTTVIGGLTMTNTFLPTTISPLTDISTPQMTSTAVAIGSSTSIVSMLIGPGGVVWNILSLLVIG